MSDRFEQDFPATGTAVASVDGDQFGSLNTLGGRAWNVTLANLGVVFHAEGLQFTGDRPLTYDEWKLLGRAVNFFGDAWQWWVGDWLNWGEALFGDDATAELGGAPADRYTVAQEITGREPKTLMNVSSVCRKVAKSRRDARLSFTHHAAVASLEPDEQTEWLREAQQAGLSASSLQQSIREAKRPTNGGGDGPSGGEHVSVRDRLQEAAVAVIDSSQPYDGGGFVVPDWAMARLREAAGRETRGGG